MWDWNHSGPRLVKEVNKFGTSKGINIFPFDKPIPYEWISMIATFRVKELIEKIKKKK